MNSSARCASESAGDDSGRWRPSRLARYGFVSRTNNRGSTQPRSLPTRAARQPFVAGPSRTCCEESIMRTSWPSFPGLSLRRTHVTARQSLHPESGTGADAFCGAGGVGVVTPLGDRCAAEPTAGVDTPCVESNGTWSADSRSESIGDVTAGAGALAGAAACSGDSTNFEITNPMTSITSTAPLARRRPRIERCVGGSGPE